MKLLALTGGIACGKSTVVGLMAKEKGYVIIDSDRIVHELQTPNSSAVKAIARKWPQVVSSEGVLDRAALGDIVFKDPKARKELARIMNGRILGTILWRLLMAWWRSGDSTVVILDSPLLYEVGFFTHIVSHVIVVACDAETQLKRLIERNGYSEEHARSRIQSQMPLDKKRRMASYVIENNAPGAGAVEQEVGHATQWIAKNTRKSRFGIGVCLAAAAVSALVYGLASVFLRKLVARFGG